MSEVFAKTLYVGWGGLDSNAHMKNTAYLDKAVDVRMMYFQEQGFSAREFARLRLGPVETLAWARRDGHGRRSLGKLNCAGAFAERGTGPPRAVRLLGRVRPAREPPGRI